jgi:hypothetical protein
MQLDDGAAHEGMRRKRIGAVAPALEHEHAMTCARQQHRRGRAGAPGADHDHVVL